MKKKSSLELMRIISMLFIIFYHIILHSGFNYTSTGGSRFLLLLIDAFFVVHVNSFVLLTGYFQSDKNAKLSKVIQVINTNWFYRVLCLVLIYVLVNYFSFPNNIDMTFHQKITSILPFDRGENWYVNCYLLTYIFSPFMNILINKMSQKQLKKLIAVLFVAFSLVGTLAIGTVIPNYAGGRCILTFILLYFVGAYLRKYPIEETRLLNVYKDKLKKYIFLGAYIFLSVVIMLFRFASINIANYGNLFFELSEIFKFMSESFLSPIVLLSSVAYFLFFKNMNFNSKIINFIGGTTFGIYLLHENIYISYNLYGWLNMGRFANSGILLVGIIIALGLIIFVACMILEIIRKGIFRFFYKRKFAEKLRNKIKGFIESLGLDINY